MKKGTYGEGHFKIKGNTAILDFHYKDLEGKDKKKQVRGIDRTDCEHKRDVFLKHLEMEKGGFNLEATIPEICIYLQDLKKGKNLISEAAYSRNISTIKVIEKSSIGRIPLIKITIGQLQTFIDGLVHYSQSVLDKVYHQLELAYKDALNNGLIDENPFKKYEKRLQKPVSLKKTKKIKALSLSDQKDLLKVLSTSNFRYKNVLLLSLLTGMRIGEILALNADDIDFETKKIHVTKTISRGENYRLLIKETKTEKGMRDVFIFEQTVPILKEVLENANDDGSLFRTENGSLVSTAMVTDGYKALAKAHNLKYWGGHSLRHTYITNACNNGIPLQVLATWVGHTDIAFMIKTYYDLLETQEPLEAAKFQKFFDENYN